MKFRQWRGLGYRLAAQGAVGRFVRGLDSAQLSRSLQISFVLMALLVANFSWYSPSHVAAAGANMYLFWDPTNGAAPSGWTVVSTYDGYFPYGAATTDTFGATTAAPSRPYTPTATATTIGLGTTTASFAATGGTIAAAGHINPTLPIVFGKDASSDPANPDIAAFRSYQIIKYAGIPNVIPQYAIAMFAGTLPTSGFTRLSANDQRLIRVDSTTAIGGSDTESNTVKIAGLSADSTNTVTNQTNGQTGPDSPATHTHAAPSSLTCTAGCGTPTCTPPSPLNAAGGSANSNTFTCVTTGDIPPYVEPVLGQANADLPTLSVAITSIFDGDPGAGWVVLSNPGGSFYHQFLRPNATYNATSQGSPTRSLGYSATYGPSIGTVINGKLNGSTGASQSDHLHSLTVTMNTLSNMVPSFNVVIAQKVSFTLNAYRWYADTSAGSTTNTTVTDAWPLGAGLDLAQDTQLPAIPSQYLPPDAINKTALRLRVQILVSGQAMTANSTNFKLQYQATGTGDCLSGPWTDVAAYGTAGAPWTYGTSNLTDNQTLTTSALTPASTRLETFGRTSTVAAGTPTAAATGQTIEFDWLIQNNNASSATEYHFRPVERPSPDVAESATPLSLYQNLSTLKAECPDLITKPGVDQELRHGEFFLVNPDPTALADPDQGFAWVD
jgi:hypothetical protein